MAYKSLKKEIEEIFCDTENPKDRILAVNSNSEKSNTIVIE